MSMDLMRIVISPTALKVAGAQLAINRAFGRPTGRAELIESKHKSPSGIKEQPIDLVEAHTGAFNRAEDLLKATPPDEATHALGIENAYIHVGRGKWVDAAVAVLLDRQGNEVVATSVGVPAPIGELGTALAYGQDKTAGSFIAKRTGCDGADWHSYMTDGKFPRVEQIAGAVFAVLVQTKT